MSWARSTVRGPVGGPGTRHSPHADGQGAQDLLEQGPLPARLVGRGSAPAQEEHRYLQWPVSSALDFQGPAGWERITENTVSILFPITVPVY